MFRASPPVGQQFRSVALRYRQPLAPSPSGQRVSRPGEQLSAGRNQGPAVAEGAAGETRRDPRMARVEAVLFVAGEPLSSRKIAQFASLADGTEARTLIRRLNRYLDSQGSAFRVEELAGGYQLLTRPKFGGWLRRLHRTPVETRLSAPALETLVVVAYRQPVVRAEIEAVRGVQCGEILRQLMERDLVRIVGKADELGRPFLYGTTRRFLQVFGLRHLDELPRADLLRTKGEQPTGRTPTTKSTAAGRNNELTQTSEPNEEPQVKLVATREPGDDPLNLTTVAVPHLPLDQVKDEDDFDYEDEDDDGEDEDDLEDEDEDLEDEDEDDDLDDDDLEDDEWEEVDDDDEWDEDEDEEDDEDDWDDEEEDEDEDEDEDWEEDE